MTAEQFLMEARARISDDPISRLAPPARAIYGDSTSVFDAHCHIFDRKTINIPYIALRMGREWVGSLLGLEADDQIEQQLDLMRQSDEQLYDTIAQKPPETDADWEQFQAEIDALVELDKYEALNFKWADLKVALAVLGKNSMGAVYEHYLSTSALPKSEAFAGRPFASVILMMDLETGWDMRPKKLLFEQVEELQMLAGVQPILPFFPVDPRRADRFGDDENLYSLFLKAFADGGKQSLFGVKCYPALGYFPSDARLDPIFQICAEKNIPVVSHCGGTIISTYEKSIQIQDSTGRSRQYDLPGDSRTDRASFLNEPANWEPVLQKHPNLKLNLGHFGGDTAWETGLAHPRIQKIVEMMTRPEWQVYADFSFNLIEEGLFGNLRATLDARPELTERLLFGTDYWVVLPSGDLKKMQNLFFEHFADRREKMAVEIPRKFLFEKTTAQPAGGEPVVV